MKRYIYLLLTIILPTLVQAQHVRVFAPRQVAVGEEFQVEYTVYSDNVDGLKLGNLPRGIEVLAGPYYASQKNFQVVNGHMSSSSSETFTYVFVATKKGSFSIPPARISVNGQTIASTPVKLLASGNANVNRAASASGGRQDVTVTRPETRNVGSKDLFIKVTANKTRVHEQEPVLLTYKVYTNVNLMQLVGKMPDLKGCHTQEIKLPQQKTFHTERIGGRTYRCTTWSEYVLYPQVTGKIHVPAVTFRGVIRPDVDDFDPFAFMSDGATDIEKNIVADGITIDVLPLPAKPDNFSGGVGRLNITAQIDKAELKEGDPLNLRIVVGGIGNLKLMKQPVVQFPEGFDKYDPKVSDKTRLTTNGVEGNMVYDFLVVPRKKGSYTIPPVKLVYFDTASNSYKTVQTTPFKINVEKGDGTTEEVATLAGNANQDIHGLKTNEKKALSGNHFYGSLSYWGILLFLVGLFATGLTVLRKRANIRGDIAGLKGKNAERVAINRLHKSKVFMEMRKGADFYDEILRALWGYASDKLNIPAEQLSRDNIKDNFLKMGVANTAIDKFISALDECEFQRYAPGDERGNMSATFEVAVAAITEIEQSVRELKSNKRMGNNAIKSATLILLMVVAGIFAPQKADAVTVKDAAKAYEKGDYLQAIKDYEALIKEDATADLYYNLGNAYYRNNSITQAVIAYERALKLAPSDADIRFNLQLAQSKTIDNLGNESEMFFVSWFKNLVYFISCDAWAAISLGALFFALAFALLYFVSTNVGVRKLGFFSALFFGLIFIASTYFAAAQKGSQQNHNGAVIVSSIVAIKSTPDAKGENVMMLHEGRRVEITDRSIDGWRGIKTPNGKTGWIAVKAIEEI